MNKRLIGSGKPGGTSKKEKSDRKKYFRKRPKKVFQLHREQEREGEKSRGAGGEMRPKHPSKAQTSIITKVKAQQCKEKRKKEIRRMEISRGREIIDLDIRL